MGGKNNSDSNLGLSLEGGSEVFQTIKLESKEAKCLQFPGFGLFLKDVTDISTFHFFNFGSISSEDNDYELELFPPMEQGFLCPNIFWNSFNSHSHHLNTYLKWPACGCP